jgi:Short C-terminal domain
VGFLGDLFGRMKDPVRGHAQVVSCSMPSDHAVYSNCSMQLVVQAEGVPATSLRETDMVRSDKWPSPGMTLPVTVDRADPTKVKIEWDEVEKSHDRAARNADAMAAMMRGEAPPDGLGGLAGGNFQVVNMSGADLSNLPEEKKAKLRMLGIDPAQLAAQQGAAPAPQAADSDDEVDEQLARLQKLGQLRDAGVLTPQEFEQQKRRILED